MGFVQVIYNLLKCFKNMRVEMKLISSQFFSKRCCCLFALLFIVEFSKMNPPNKRMQLNRSTVEQRITQSDWLNFHFGRTRVCEKMVLCGNHHLQKSISLNRVPSNSDDLHKMVVHVQWAHWNKANRVLNHFAVFALCRLALHLILLKFDFSSKHTMGAHDFTQFWKLVR